MQALFRKTPIVASKARAGAMVVAGLILCIAGMRDAEAQSLPDLRAQATTSLDGTDPARTIDLARAILAQSPEDFEGFFILSLGLSRQGVYPEAADAAANAYRVAITDRERVQAARLAAGVHVKAGQLLRAQWWLRIAANAAKTTADRETVATEFRRVRADNPLGGRLTFSIAPSDNINGGSEVASIFLGDFELVLGPESRALSGVEISGSGELSYRLSRSAKQSTEVVAYLYHRGFILSDETREALPDARGRDFALSLGEVALRHRRQVFPGLGPTSLRFSVGAIYYGGDPLWDYQRLVLGQDVPIGQGGWLTVQLGYQNQVSRSDRQTDATNTELVATYRHRRANSDQWAVTLLAQKHEAIAPTDTFDFVELSTEYDLGKPVFGTRLSFGASIGRTKYDEFSLSFTGREDHHASLSAKATFLDLSYYGFSPSLSLTAERTESDIDRFSATGVQARIGIESNF